MNWQQHSFYISVLLFFKRETVITQMLTIFLATVLSSPNETESSNTRRKRNSLATRLSPSKLRVRWVSDNCGVYPEHTTIYRLPQQYPWSSLKPQYCPLHPPPRTPHFSSHPPTFSLPSVEFPSRPWETWVARVVDKWRPASLCGRVSFWLKCLSSVKKKYIYIYNTLLLMVYDTIIVLIV